jgi:hypothetical protein
MLRDTPDMVSAQELVLTCTNDGDHYRQQILPVIRNQAKHARKGNADQVKSLIAWACVADEAARRYTAAHGAPGDKWYRLFPPNVRVEAANLLMENYAEAVAECTANPSLYQ